nr:zinc finger protein STOP1 homolog [Malus domestica]
MSFPGQPFLTPPENLVQSTNEDPAAPLRNLSMVRTRMDSLQSFLTESIHANALISKDQMDMVSTGIASAIHEIISNGAALLAFAQNSIPSSDPTRTHSAKIEASEVKKEIEVNDCGKYDADGGEIVEVDAMELLAEHIHYCEICGKGFKRDANENARGPREPEPPRR